MRVLVIANNDSGLFKFRNELLSKMIADGYSVYFTVESAQESGYILYHGRQSDVRPFIRDSYCTVLPSYHEGTANVLLESAATDRPVLASNIPGCKEAFDEGVTGFGFEPKKVDSLVAAIEKFIALPYEQKSRYDYNMLF